MQAIKVEANRERFGKASAAVQRQVPFALASTLTELAKEARAEVQDDLHKTFELRGQWVPRSIRFRPAGKRDLTAEVGTISPFLGLHATGGWRRPEPGSEWLGVPVEARDPSSRKTTRGRWPGRYLRRRGAVLLPSRRGDGGQTLLVRKGRKGAKRATVAYRMRRRVRISARWPLEQQVRAVVSRRFDSVFRRRLAEAIRTARR